MRFSAIDYRLFIRTPFFLQIPHRTFHQLILFFFKSYSPLTNFTFRTQKTKISTRENIKANEEAREGELGLTRVYAYAKVGISNSFINICWLVPFAYPAKHPATTRARWFVNAGAKSPRKYAIRDCLRECVRYARCGNFALWNLYVRSRWDVSFLRITVVFGGTLLCFVLELGFIKFGSLVSLNLSLIHGFGLIRLTVNYRVSEFTVIFFPLVRNRWNTGTFLKTRF